MQMLLSQGFAVLMPNVRGSSGQGRSWAASDDIEKRPDAVQDLIHARHFLAAHGAIHPERIALMGQSYGGCMVNAAVTGHPDLWKACVNYYGIVDFACNISAARSLQQGAGPAWLSCC